MLSPRRLNSITHTDAEIVKNVLTIFYILREKGYGGMLKSNRGKVETPSKKSEQLKHDPNISMIIKA